MPTGAGEVIRTLEHKAADIGGPFHHQGLRVRPSHDEKRGGRALRRGQGRADVPLHDQPIGEADRPAEPVLLAEY